MLRSGRLVTVLPGVYCVPAVRDHPTTGARAAMLWAGPDAVLTGLAAARLTFWPGAPAGTVTLALPASARRSRAGVTVELRRVRPS